MNFQTDLFTGRFGYSVPIIVAPARQGAEPKLALTYNSSGGNGWCGVGWSLEVGYIERETKKGVPIVWGTHDVGTQYDDSQGFVFNLEGAGGTLVNVGGNEYRNEIDGAFLKFVLQSTNTWVVTDKGGNKFYFGESPASRMQMNRTGWTPNAAQSTFRWALSRIIDVNGNETIITYSLDPTDNFLYLSQISYNGNVNSPTIPADRTISFTLAERGDDVLGHTPGGGYSEWAIPTGAPKN